MKLEGTKVTGVSDDLIELDGDLYDELNWYSDSGEKATLGFSDGTMLSVQYDDDGIWRFSLKVKGFLYDKKIEGNIEEDKNDEIYFKKGLKWCLFGEQFHVVIR